MVSEQPLVSRGTHAAIQKPASHLAERCPQLRGGPQKSSTRAAGPSPVAVCRAELLLLECCGGAPSHLELFAAFPQPGAAWSEQSLELRNLQLLRFYLWYRASCFHQGGVIASVALPLLFMHPCRCFCTRTPFTKDLDPSSLQFFSQGYARVRDHTSRTALPSLGSLQLSPSVEGARGAHPFRATSDCCAVTGQAQPAGAAHLLHHCASHSQTTLLHTYEWQ